MSKFFQFIIRFFSGATILTISTVLIRRLGWRQGQETRSNSFNQGVFLPTRRYLAQILNADLNDEFVIEGIEDFDRYTDEGVIFGQVKYYAEQNLTESVLRDPLHKLFVHFHGLEEAQRAGRSTGTFQKLRSILVSFPSSDLNR